MNMGIKYDKGIGDTISNLGESIRMGRWYTTSIEINKLYPNYRFVAIPSSMPFNGKMGSRELKRLKIYVNQIADAIEKSGQ